MLMVYDQAGEDAGSAFAQRFVWEIAEAMTEVHGLRRTAELLYQVADAIAGNKGAAALEPDLPTEEDEDAADALEDALDELREAAKEIRHPSPPPFWRVSPWLVLVVFVIGLGTGWSLHR